MGASWFLALLLVAQTFRPTLRDLTFLPIFQKANPKIQHVAELKRMELPGNQDLVIVAASPYPLDTNKYTGDASWPIGGFVGVFLQDHSSRDGITTLALVPGSNGYVHLERVRVDEVLLSRTWEFGSITERTKLVFDASQKKLLSQTSFQPFLVGAAVELNGRIYFLAQEIPKGSRTLVLRSNADETGFEIVSDRETARTPALPRLLSSWDRTRLTLLERLPLAFGSERQYRLIQVPNDSWGPQNAIVDATPGGQSKYPLPQSTMAEFVARRTDLTYMQTTGWRPAPENLSDEIGPHQLWGDKLWFGKTFYGGEGHVGVGGFGYFDAATGAYTIYSPPELWPWSVSALRVESDAVWLGLVHRGEYGGPSGGLLRWDRVTHEVQKYPLRSVVNAIYQSPNALYVGTQDGIAVLRTGHQFFEYYIVDMTANGNYRVVPAF